jgi:signal transduction histidine kinase
MITKYSTNSINCISNNKYKLEFYNSNSKSATYKLVNQKFNNKTLIHAENLDNGTYLFISSSLQPLDTTVRLLSKQLIIVCIIDIIIALIVGYFISKKISKPIENMNQKAQNLAKGIYDFKFNENCNIREIDQLASTLDYAKEELKETDELRRELMANVSHDLKTPLTMIKGYAEMIRDLNNEEKRIDNLNVIIEEADRLNLLVEDILELSKIQANKETLNIEKFDLSELVRNIIKRYDIFKEEGYIFELDIPSKIIVSADKKKIEQVIYNLINNAINYTGDDNKIIINIKQKNGILVEIKDTGKGINKEELPYIWDKYYHSHKKHKRNKIGTGIGLSIVKNILEIHKFEYGVNTSKNKGTTFYFIIK